MAPVFWTKTFFLDVNQQQRLTLLFEVLNAFKSPWIIAMRCFAAGVAGSSRELKPVLYAIQSTSFMAMSHLVP